MKVMVGGGLTRGRARGGAGEENNYLVIFFLFLNAIIVCRRVGWRWLRVGLLEGVSFRL